MEGVRVALFPLGITPWDERTRGFDGYRDDRVKTFGRLILDTKSLAGFLCLGKCRRF
jgi:hypothetical protein